MAVRIFGGPGFIVQDLAIATDGVVTPDIVYSYDLPAPRRVGSSDEYLARLYGVDLVFQGDFVVQGNGDLQRTEGLEAFRASFARSLAMPKGDIFWRPNYGIGLAEFLNRRANAQNIHEMKNRIQQTLTSDPAVEEITRIDVYVSRETIGLIEIFVDVVVSGQPISMGFAIRSTV